MSTNSTVKQLPIAQRVYLHGELLQHGILPTCVTCKHGVETSFAEFGVDCRRYETDVPLAVIVQGCEGWEQDIPF